MDRYGWQVVWAAAIEVLGYPVTWYGNPPEFEYTINSEPIATKIIAAAQRLAETK